MPLKYTKCFTVGMTHQYISLCHTNYSLNVKKKEIKQIYLNTHTLRVGRNGDRQQTSRHASYEQCTVKLRQALAEEGQLCYQGLLCV